VWLRCGCGVVAVAVFYTQKRQEKKFFKKIKKFLKKYEKMFDNVFLLCYNKRALKERAKKIKRWYKYYERKKHYFLNCGGLVASV
jgi:hypothetical protein